MKTQVDARYGTPLLLSGLLQCKHAASKSQRTAVKVLVQYPGAGRALFGFRRTIFTNASELVAILLLALRPSSQSDVKNSRASPPRPEPTSRASGWRLNKSARAQTITGGGHGTRFSVISHRSHFWKCAALVGPRAWPPGHHGHLAQRRTRSPRGLWWRDGANSASSGEGANQWSDEDMRNWVLQQLAGAGKNWDARHPFIDAALASGHRLHVAFPPLDRQGILVSPSGAWRAPTEGASRRPVAHALERSPSPRLVGASLRESPPSRTRWGFGSAPGATGSGKTTLANDLLSEVPAHERILALEDTPRTRPDSPSFHLTHQPAAQRGRLWRGHPAHAAQAGASHAAGSSHPGRMPGRRSPGSTPGPSNFTGHRGWPWPRCNANSPRDALRRIELLCLLAAQGSVPLQAIRELLAAHGVQWIAQVKRTTDPGGQNLARNPRALARGRPRRGHNSDEGRIVKGALLPVEDDLKCKIRRDPAQTAPREPAGLGPRASHSDGKLSKRSGTAQGQRSGRQPGRSGFG